MKTKILLCSLLTLCVSASLRCKAQDTPQQNFIQQTVGWFTSQNTNLTWTNISLELAAGAISGADRTAQLTDLRYNLGAEKRLGLNAKMQNADIAGTITEATFGVSYAVISSFDVKLSGGVDAGYSWDRQAAVINPNIEVAKNLGQHTYTKLNLGVPIFTQHQDKIAPRVALLVGATF